VNSEGLTALGAHLEPPAGEFKLVVLVRGDPPSWLSARLSGCTDRASANAPAFAGSGLEQLRDPLVGDPQDATGVTHRKVSSLD